MSQLKGGNARFSAVLSDPYHVWAIYLKHTQTYRHMHKPLPGPRPSPGLSTTGVIVEALGPVLLQDQAVIEGAVAVIHKHQRLDLLAVHQYVPKVQLRWLCLRSQPVSFWGCPNPLSSDHPPRKSRSEAVCKNLYLVLYLVACLLRAEHWRLYLPPGSWVLPQQGFYSQRGIQ